MLPAVINDALDNGELWALMTNGRYWRMRRNGRTQTWKRSPWRFRTPFKCGLYVYGALTEEDCISVGFAPERGMQYLISERNPN